MIVLDACLFVEQHRTLKRSICLDESHCGVGSGMRYYLVFAPLLAWFQRAAAQDDFRSLVYFGMREVVLDFVAGSSASDATFRFAALPTLLCASFGWRH
jgi:hypothetical protein